MSAYMETAKAQFENANSLRDYPFRDGCNPAPAEYLDGLEAYNANPRKNNRNDLAYAYAKQYGLLELAGSDYHQLPDLGLGGVYLSALPQDSIALKDVLKNGGIEELRCK